MRLVLEHDSVGKHALDLLPIGKHQPASNWNYSQVSLENLEFYAPRLEGPGNEASSNTYELLLQIQWNLS